MTMAIAGVVLAQAAGTATKGAVATKGAELPAAGVSLPLIILTTIALCAIIFGATKLFVSFKKF